MINEMNDLWAIVELMGHVRIAGRLSEVEKFGGKLARLDIPQEGGDFLTRLFGASAVYCITFVTEDVARHIAKSNRAEPVQPWDFPKALNSPSEPLQKEPVQYAQDHRSEDDGDDNDNYDPDDPDMPRW